MFSYNTTPHSSSNFMPFELLFGHKPRIPTSIQNSIEPVYNYEDYLNELKFRIKTAAQIARSSLLNSKLKSKTYYDKRKNTRPKDFQVDQLVLLKNEVRKSKFDPIWLGPYKVIDTPTSENTNIKIGRHIKTIHNNRLRCFKSQND